MANISLVTRTTVVVDKISVEMTLEEAAALASIGSHIGGGCEARKLLENMACELEQRLGASRIDWTRTRVVQPLYFE
jgi:hypothetical protein